MTPIPPWERGSDSLPGLAGPPPQRWASALAPGPDATAPWALPEAWTLRLKPDLEALYWLTPSHSACADVFCAVAEDVLLAPGFACEAAGCLSSAARLPLFLGNICVAATAVVLPHAYCRRRQHMAVIVWCLRLLSQAGTLASLRQAHLEALSQQGAAGHVHQLLVLLLPGTHLLLLACQLPLRLAATFAALSVLLQLVLSSLLFARAVEGSVVASGVLGVALEAAEEVVQVAMQSVCAVALPEPAGAAACARELPLKAVVFLQVACGLLLPLYLAYHMEYGGKRRYLQLQERGEPISGSSFASCSSWGSSRSSSSSSKGSGFAGAEVADHSSDGDSAGGGAGCSCSSSSSGCGVNPQPARRRPPQPPPSAGAPPASAAPLCAACAADRRHSGSSPPRLLSTALHLMAASVLLAVLWLLLDPLLPLVALLAGVGEAGKAWLAGRLGARL